MTLAAPSPCGAARFARCKWGLSACVAGFAMFLVGCGAKPPVDTGKAAVEPIPVTATSVKTVPMRRSVTAVGTLYAYEDVMLAPKWDGRVLRVLKNEGDTAFPGEVLLELDPTYAQFAVNQARPAFEAELRKLKLLALPESDAGFTSHLPTVDAVAQARANLDLARSEYARIEEEVKRGVGSRQVLDSANNKVKVNQTGVELAETEARVTLANARRLKAALEDAEDRLNETQVRAPVPEQWAAWAAIVGPAANPIRYSVAARMVSNGTMIPPMQVKEAYRLVIDTALKLRVAVPEKYRPEVQVGMLAEVRVDAYPDRIFAGRVSRIFPTVDPGSRAFVTEISVPNFAKELGAGGFATAEVVTHTDTAVLSVPPEAIVTFAGVTKVFVAEGNVAKAVDVEVGVRAKDQIEVRGDLKPDARVITSGQSQLVDGSPIRLR